MSQSPVAQNLVAIIHENPGIHFRELERAAKLASTGQLRHHVDRLQRSGKIVEAQDGGFHRFFIAGDHDRRLRQRMIRFSRPLAQRLARVLLVRPMTRSEIRRTLSCAESTLGYYLCRMEEAGDIQREVSTSGHVYSLVDPDAVREVLKAQRAAMDSAYEESRSVRPAHLQAIAQMPYAASD